jgi:hypothetical protein
MTASSDIISIANIGTSDRGLPQPAQARHGVAGRSGDHLRSRPAAGASLGEASADTLSPYNTYLNPGLPPGPITQPRDSSIIAALYPAPTGYLFFVAQPDGKHIFSANYADHLAAIRRVRGR